ncbi:MAG: YgfZ/GcvT domain-containing protein [Burkholderiales bacterium]
MAKSGFCELAQFGLIRFSGEEAQDFLHNQLTCDVSALEPGRSTYGAYCTPKGRVLVSFLLWRAEQGFFMQLPSSLCGSIQKQISKYILRSKVKAVDATGEWTLVGVMGRDAAALVQRVVGPAPQAAHEVAQIPGAMIVRLPGDRFEIALARDKAPVTLRALGSGAENIDVENWQRQIIRAGVPVILPATQEEFVPQMINLDLIGGVSYDKGCYPGQEIVARMHYRGTLKQRMYLASIGSDERPEPGQKLYSPGFGEQACGTVVNAARSPDGGHDLLAVVQISAAERGNVHWKTATGPALKLLKLPYSVT